MNKAGYILIIACSLWCPPATAQEPQHVLAPANIQALVPDYLKGFKQNEEAVSKLIRLGELQYSLCEKRFKKNDQAIKILLFDFKEAPIMYSQAMKKWNQVTPVLTDSLIQSPVLMENCSGWESFNRNSNTSQIFLGICDRFFLSLSGDNVELKALQEVLKQFKLDKFPK